MTRRAERVSVTMPVRYRVAGESAWWTTTVVNVSESGILFGPASVSSGTQIELLFRCHVTIGSLIPGQHMCLGRAVRVAQDTVAVEFAVCRHLLDGHSPGGSLDPE
jgi:hypothetical protein